MANTPPPAPPPVDISKSDKKDTPYDFFLKDNPKQKKKLGLGLGSGSFKKRLFIGIGGTVALLILIIAFISIVFGGNKGINQQLLELTQEQTEIVRVADIGVTKARGAVAKNLATTTKYSVSSSLGEVTALLKKKPKPKELALKKNSQTDQILESAATNNNFDEVFTETIQNALKTYQTNTKKFYDATSSEKQKLVLAVAYDGVNVLLGVKAKP